MLALRLGDRPALAALLLALALPGCAPANPDTGAGQSVAAGTAQLSYGTIVSMRGAGVLASGAPGRNDMRGTILGAVSGGKAAGEMLAPGQAVEFIIQEDNSTAPVSVVQGNDGNFRLGERVALSRGARTRIARSGI